MADSLPASPRRRPSLWLWLVGVAGLIAFAGFIALGNWQLERRVWKQELMARVDARVHAPAVAAPAVADWPAISRESDEYRHIWLQGRFLADRDTLVVAATELGSGYWVLTPIETIEQGTVLVNRGFVAQGVEPAAVPEAEVRISGLLRLTEPGGGFLRDNAPQTGRWYSRDVAAIAAAEGLALAPYFIDAAADQPGSPGDAGPVGGLTVIRFHDSHLVYALTWYGLAAMVAGAGLMLLRDLQRKRR